MQLVKCAACGADISKAAGACPKCGHPRGPSMERRIIGVVILLAVIAAGLWAFLQLREMRF